MGAALPGQAAARPAAALRPYLYGAGAILCWASFAAVVGEGLHRVAPEQILTWGFLTAGGALSLRDWARHGSPVPRWPGVAPLLVGMWGIWGSHTLLVMAFALAPDVEANILNYTWPLWIILLSSLLPGHRRSWRIALAGSAGFAGVVLVLGGDRSAPAPGAEPWAPLGLALALGAGFAWGSFTVLARRLIPTRQENMALFCLLAATLSALGAAARGRSLALPLDAWWVPAYVGLVPWGLSLWLWERALQRCNLQVLGLLTFLTPPLSTLLLALVSGSPVGWRHLAGLALILAGAAWGGRWA